MQRNQHQQPFSQTRSTMGTTSLTNTSDHRNVAFELGGSGGSFSSPSSTRATTSPRTHHEWNASSRGMVFDSGYQTDSMLNASSSRTLPPSASRSTGDSVPPITDDQQEQFRMSMEDLRPPPGTFRPVSPSPVTSGVVARLNHHHPGSSGRLSGFRPPSVPLADLPDNEDQLLVDEEVEWASARPIRGGDSSGDMAQQNLPDLVLETTVMDVRFRSHSVPVFPDQMSFVQANAVAESRITAVAMGLRRIGDEISNSRAGGRITETVYSVTQTRRTRGYSVSHADRPEPIDRRRMSTGAHAVTGVPAYSFPGDSTEVDGGPHSVSARNRRLNYGGSAGRGSAGSNDSWRDRFHWLFRTLSGVDIADTEASNADADDADDLAGLGAVGGRRSGGGGGGGSESVSAMFEEPEDGEEN